MRYLVVYAKSEWQVIDVANNCVVIARGSREEMTAEAKRLTDELNSVQKVANLK